MSEKTDSYGMLEAALRMTAAMAEEQNVVILLRRGLELCKQVLDCDRAFLIGEAKDGAGEIIHKDKESDTNAPFSSTALKLVKEKQEPLLISDTISDETLRVQESISSHEIRTVLCSRLDALHGAYPGKEFYLYLDSRTDRHPFSQRDLEIFRLLTTLMANLVKNSDLLAQHEATIEELKSRVEEKRFEDLIFSSPRFEKTISLVKQAAPTDVPILLIGETGTGKEILARSAHKLSKRNDKPFLAVNCGAIPPNLIESQLFGHEKGAFTGAVAAKKGHFEEANGGTLFLDEVGELPTQVQPQFLRALQEGEIMRVGSSKTIKVDVRIISATNVDLEKAVDEGRFRKDLFFRLNVMPITVPPMRERGEDALLLAHFFLKQYCESLGSPGCKFSREAEKAILVYEWPGNVREIQNRIQRAVITAGGSTISREDLGLETDEGPRYTSLKDARESVDREMIAQAVQRAPGNLTNAAKILDIDRKSLRLLLEKYGMKC
ncbi:MAG: AAA domain-containing protein [Chitinivibrionales bacterium]|nr:AAA domain-containing protein [Chitinivibrionales bacterium]